MARMPRTQRILEDSTVQPFAHLEPATVRTFEIACCGGNTSSFSAKTLDEMESTPTYSTRFAET